MILLKKCNKVSKQKLEDLISEIRNGHYKDAVNRIRKEPDSKNRQWLKFRLLPIFHVGSSFKSVIPPERTTCILTQNFISNDGFCILDYDHVGDPTTLINTLSKCENCIAAFVSVSGNGVKAIIRHQKVENISEYRFIKRNLNVPHKELVDPACLSNVCQGSFVSYAPGIYFNPDATFEEIEIPDFSQRESLHSSFLEESFSDGVLDKILKAILPWMNIGNYDEYFTVGSALAKLDKPQFWLAILEQTDWRAYGRSYSEREAIQDFNTYRASTKVRLQNNQPCYGLGKLMYMARENGFDDIKTICLYGGLR